jgi:hypothetical protein
MVCESHTDKGKTDNTFTKTKEYTLPLQDLTFGDILENKDDVIHSAVSSQ